MLPTSAIPEQIDFTQTEATSRDGEDGLHIEEIVRRARRIHREHGGLFGYGLEDWNQAWREGPEASTHARGQG